MTIKHNRARRKAKSRNLNDVIDDLESVTIETTGSYYSEEENIIEAVDLQVHGRSSPKTVKKQTRIIRRGKQVKK